MKDDNWIVCNSCDSEYKIVTSITNDQTQSFCPFCGNGLENQFEEEYEYFEEE